jgi:putative transcriptional regulator
MIKCRLKVLLAEHDMTQKELAEKTGIRATTVSDMCNNKSKHIPLDTLDILCNFFDCNLSDILIHEKSDKITKTS